MNLKSILVGLAQGENLAIVEKYALEIAKYFGAEAHGIHVIDVRKLYSPFVEDVVYSTGFASIPNCQSVVSDHLEKVAGAIKEHFEQSLSEYKLRGDFLLKRGIVSSEIANEAKKHDLLVIGTKGEFFALQDILLGTTFSEVVRRVNRPVVVVPANCGRFYLRRILVAYDGSEKANNALSFVAGSVRNYNMEVELLVVDDGSIVSPEKVYEEAEILLNRHAVKWAGRIVKGIAVECILSHARAARCDMLSFGTFSSGIKRLFVGSVAEGLLEQTELPVLLMR